MAVRIAEYLFIFIVSFAWLYWNLWYSFSPIRFLPSCSIRRPERPFHDLQPFPPSWAEIHKEVADMDGLVVESLVLVGGGAFANIYPGVLRVKEQQIPVAIKVLRGARIERDSTRKFFQEVFIWRTLSHDNILPLYGISDIDRPGTLAMVSPWMENGDLAHFLTTHPELSFEDRVSILTQVAIALQYLHSRSIIHGDLKGDNILMKDDRNIVLCDFGVSIWEGTPQVQDQMIDNFCARWAAPEVVFPSESTGLPAFSKASDIFSFGNVMLQVLTGNIPYHWMETSYSVMAHVSKISHYPRPERAEFVTDEMWMFMRQCWARTPSDRPSIQGVLSFLEGIADH